MKTGWRAIFRVEFRAFYNSRLSRMYAFWHTYSISTKSKPKSESLTDARTPLFPVRSRGIGSPSSALVGQRACSAGTAVSGCLAKSPSFEAGAGPGFEKNGRLKVPRTAKPQISFADWELLQQGISLDPLLQSICDFLDDHEGMMEAVWHDLERGLKSPRDKSQRIDSAAGAAFPGPDAGQELDVTRLHG